MVKVLKSMFPKNYKGQGNRTPGMYVDDMLLKNLLASKKAIKNDWDMFFVVDGQEGVGKSVLAQQIGVICDPTLCLERITFSAATFKKAILSAKKYQCVIFDEAYGSLASRRAMSLTNHMLVDMMAEIRQKNLFVILVLPSFFELDKYPAIHRCRCLIHVYHHRFQRGFFRLYSYKKKRTMYLLGKKIYNYKCVKSSFRGRFMNFYVVDKENYKEKKLKSLRATKLSLDKPKERMTQAERALYYLTKELNLKAFDLKHIAEKIGSSPRYFYRKLKDLETNEVELEIKKNLVAPKFKMPDKPNH